MTLGNLTDPLAIKLSSSGPQNVQIPIPPSPQNSGSGGNLVSAIANFLTKATDVATKLQPVFTQAKNTVQLYENGGTQWQQQTAQQQAQVAQPAPGMSTNTKILLGVGAALAVGAIIYATRK